jgi:DivIVA domain-containing protein
MARKDKNRAPAAAGEPGSNRITPVDIQQKEFRESFRGYNEREVDQFLDLVTEELARLHAENRRLQEQVEFRQTMPLGSASAEAEEILRRAKAEAERIVARAASAGTAPAVSASDDPGAVEMVNRFLAREREFLQSLGSKIQQHIEAVREDVRAAKQARPIEVEVEPAVPPPPPEEDAPSEVRQGMTQAMTPIRDQDEDVVTLEDESGSGPSGPTDPPEASIGSEGRSEPDAGQPPVSRSVSPDDPGRVQHPEPGPSASGSAGLLGRFRGRTGPSVAIPSPEEDTGQERSLRELFWGED